MNSNYTTDTPNSEQLKRDVQHDIHKVNKDLDEIQRRLTPGQILDDALFSHGSKNAGETFDYLKSNPLGTTLITLGALCLMEDENHESYEHKGLHKAHELSERAGTKLHEAQDKLQSKVHEAQNKMHDLQHKVQDKVQAVRHKNESAGFEDVGLGEGMDVEGVGSNLRSTKQKVTSKINETKEFVNEKLHNVERTVKDKTHDALESAKSLDPLTYLALGAGLGTITGASIPVTGKEKQMLHSQFEQEFSEFAKDLESALNESANILKNQFIGGFTDINMRLF